MVYLDSCPQVVGLKEAKVRVPVSPVYRCPLPLLPPRQEPSQVVGCNLVGGVGSQIAEGSALSEVPSVLATGCNLVGWSGESLPGTFFGRCNGGGDAMGVVLSSLPPTPSRWVYPPCNNVRKAKMG